MSENYKNKNQVNYKFDFNLSKNEKKGSLGCASLKTITSEKQQKKTLVKICITLILLHITKTH